MIHEKITIQVPGYSHQAELYTYFLGRSPEMRPERKRPLVLICPGGGYVMTSDREAEPVAMQFLAMGYHAAILRYSVSPAVYPEALLQVAKSVSWLKEQADEAVGVDEAALRPAGMVLCYPVITSGEKAHEDSFKALLGDRLEELKEEVSLEKQVNKDVPKTFLWHTQEDGCVPVENSLLFYQALHKNGIPAELHIFPEGGHGLSLANEETMNNDGSGVQEACQSWISLVRKWMETI